MIMRVGIKNGQDNENKDKMVMIIRIRIKMVMIIKIRINMAMIRRI